MISRLLNPKRWSRIAQFFKQRAPRTISAPRATGIEVLENRIAPASLVSLSGMNLSVIGDGGDDTITVSIIGSDYVISDPNGITDDPSIVDDGNPNTSTIPFASVGTLIIHTGAGSDSVEFATSHNLTALTATVSGNITQTAGTLSAGMLTLYSSGGDIGSSLSPILVSANTVGGSTSNGDIFLRAVGQNLTASSLSAGGAGSITLSTSTSGDVRVDNIIAGGTVTINSIGAIEEFGIGGIGNEISAPAVSLNAATGIGVSGAGGAIELNVDALSGTTTTGGLAVINEFALSVAGFSVTGASGGVAITTLNGDITIDSAISLALSNGAVTLTLDPSGPAHDLQLGAGIIAGSGVITLNSTNNINIGSGNISTTGDVTLAADNGLITTGSGVVGGNLLNVSTEGNITLNASVAALAASTTNGGISLTNSQALAIGSVAINGGDIDITSSGSMTVNGPVSQVSGMTSGDSITLIASGAAAELTLIGSITPDFTDAVDAGTIILSAGSNVSLNGGASINITGDASVTINAGFPDAGPNNANADLTLNGTLILGSAHLTLTASDNVTLNGAGADITTAGNFTVNADRDGSAVGTGGTFSQNNIASFVQASSVSITAANVVLLGIIDAGTGNIDVEPSIGTSPIYINNGNLSTGLNLNLAELLALRTNGGEITIGAPADTGTLFIGSSGTVGLGLIGADYTLNGGAIDFNGGISIQDDHILSLHSLNGITASGGNVVDVVIGGASGALVITANDDVTLSTRITNLGSTNTGAGTFTLNNNNNILTVTDPITADAVSLTTGTATLTISDTISATGDLTIIADGLALGDAISGGGILTIKGNLATTTIGIGNGSTGTLNLNADEVAKITDGFSRINLGASIQTGAVSIVTPAGPTAVVFHDPVYIIASTASTGNPPTTGSVEIESGPLVGDDDASFNIIAKDITFSGAAPGITTASGAIALNGAMLLEGDTTFDSSGGGGGGNITLNGTINGNQALVINADTAEVFIAGQNPSPASGTSVGGTERLASVDVTGGILRLQPNTFSNGSQTYTGSDIRLLGGRFITFSDGLADISFNGPVTLFNSVAINTKNSNLTFVSTVNSEPTGKGALILTTGEGIVTFNADIGGSVVPLKSLTIASASTANFGNGALDEVYVAGGLSITSDEINFGGGANTVHVAGTLSLIARSADTAVLVGGAESGDLNTLSISEDDIGAIADGGASILITRSQGVANIVISTNSVFHDPVTFRQRTGGTIYLNSALEADGADGGFLFRGPATRLNGDITTAGGLIDIENGVVEKGLVENFPLKLETSGGNIITRGSLVAFAGGEDIELIAGSGQIQLLSRVGSTSSSQPVFGDVTLTASGETRIEKGITAASVTVDGGGTTFTKGRILTTASGNQTYLDAVQLLGSAEFVSQNVSGLIEFVSTVDSVEDKNYSLSVTNRTPNATGSSVKFNASVGGNDRINSLRINTNGDVTFDAGIAAASITTRSLDLTVNAVDTTLSQSYAINGVASFLGAINATKLTITTGSDITSSLPWNVSGQAKITAPGATVSIGGSGNEFGSLSLRAGNATIVEDGNMAIYSAAISGTLNLTTNATLLENGDLTQISRINALRLETSVTGIAGSITLDHTSNRFAQIGRLTAGTDIELVDRYNGFALLDGAISTTSGDILLVANPLGTKGSFRTVPSNLPPTASLSAGGGGRWTIYSYYGSSVPLNYDLFVQFGPDNRAVLAHPGANPFPTGNTVLYILTGQA